MYCRNCGNEIREGSSFCGKCGTKIEVKFEENKKTNKTNKNIKQKKYVVISLLLFVIIFISVCVIVNINPREEMVEKEIKNEFITVLGYNENTKNPVTDVIVTGLEIEIQKIIKVKNDTYDVVCILSNYDVVKALNQLKDTENNISLKGYYELLAEEIANTDKISNEATISVVKDETYIVMFTQEQFNYASGGLMNLVEEFLDKEGVSNEK